MLNVFVKVFRPFHFHFFPCLLYFFDGGFGHDVVARVVVLVTLAIFLGAHETLKYTLLTDTDESCLVSFDAFHHFIGEMILE